jgi:CHAT domain-containing protein/tetratricopeptide (TPR) repeat protein
MRDRVAICFENISRPLAAAAATSVLAFGLCACAKHAHEPVEMFGSSLAIGGETPASWTRSLQRGVYLVEIREIDIDARVTIGVGSQRVTLEDRLPRHGAVYKVVSADAPVMLEVGIASADHRLKRGHVSVRLMRWNREVAARPDDLEAGYEAQSTANELSAEATPESWAKAADKLHEAISHFETAREDAARGQAAYSLAYVQYGPRDQYTAAVRACEIAAEAFGRADDDVGVHNAATLRAAAEIELASSMKADTQRAEQRALYAEVDRRLADSAKFFTARKLGIRAEYAVNMRAVRAVSMGDYESAAPLFRQAVEMARTNEDVREQAQSLANLAAVHIYLGHVAQAAQEYEALLPLIDRTAQPYQYALTLGNFGFALIALGDFDRALALHAEALDIYARLGEEDERAVELAALGGLYFRMGDAQRALDTLEAAIFAQERISDIAGLAGTLRVAGNVASALDRHRAALDYLERSARIDANPQSVARTRVLVAGEMRAIGKLEAAEAQLEGPLRSQDELVLSNALEERARIRLARGEQRAAIDDLRHADAGYANLGLEINRIDTSSALSQALLSTGDVSGAIASADEAIGIVGRIRVKSANPEWRARFLSSRYSPYEARIAAAFAEEGENATWHAFRIAEDVRARSLADELTVGTNSALRNVDPREDELRARLTSLQLRLESRIQRQESGESGTFSIQRAIAETRAQLDAIRTRGGVAARASSLPESLALVKSRIPRDTAVLAYFVGDSGGYAWLLTRDALRSARLPGRKPLEQLILAAQREERSGKPDGTSARELGRKLLADLLDGVDERRLLILADGPLNSVPFASLPVSPAGDGLLVDRFTIGNAPSLALAMATPTHGPSRNTRVAVVSDPIYAPDDGRLRLALNGAGHNMRGPAPPSPNNLTRLPYSALEASAVAKAFGADDTIRLSGFDAVPSRVMQLPGKDLAVLHFATHAVARADSPDQSALYLSEYAPDGTLLPVSRLTPSDIARSGLRADLVVLSGCATGDGSALRGEGVLGLTYGFLANGSHSVVASLWPIEDASTARFMNEFYRAYREYGRAADALRTAQLRSRATTGAWSSFVVRANEFP